MSVIAYVRVSTEMQTLENQEYEILNYCRSAGLVIDKWV
jgi:DNA invertase Pin-like site-specific DNA recombinase